MIQEATTIIQARENGDLGGSNGDGKKWSNSDRSSVKDICGWTVSRM